MLPANTSIRYVTSQFFCQLQLGKFLRVSQYSVNTNDSSSTSDSSSSSSDSSDDESEVKKVSPPTQNKEALDKLNTLLQTLAKESFSSPQGSAISEKLAKPKQYFKKLNAENDEPKEQVPVTEKTVSDVAKEVAESIGGNAKQTESELLNKLLSHSAEVNKKQIEQDAANSKISLSDLISGMKIDRTQNTPQPEVSRARVVRRMLAGTRKEDQWKTMEHVDFDRKPPVRQQLGRVDLSGGELLNIFPNLANRKDPVQLSTWEKMKAKELRIAVTHPPRNHFEQMIVWTEQGKLWNFPIDNEQGMDEEAKVSFVDHIFLERYLEPWCPKKGPIRHFMELVCVGLSKNSYCTSQAKKAHIEWYRDYFMSKKDLLKEVGAM